MKKLLLLITAILISMSSFAYDFEVDGIYYNISSESQRTVAVTNNGNVCYSGDIMIPEVVEYGGKKYTITSIAEFAFLYAKTLTHINLPPTCNYIESRAFDGCSSLTEISLPDSCFYIGSSAFSGCNLNQVIIPEKCAQIGDNAFSCPNLKVAYCLCITPSIKNTQIDPFPTTNCEIFVPKKELYSKWGENKKQLKEFIIADKNQFTYSGKKPDIKFSNNLPFLNSNISTVLASDAGSYETTIQVKYTGEMEFEVKIPYTYTIDKAEAMITVDDATKLYGDKNPSFKYVVTGLIGEDVLDNISISTSADSLSGAGTYAIKATAESKNYDITITDGTLTIQKAPLIVSVIDKKKKYGEVNPDFSLSYSGLKCDDPFPTMTTDFIFNTKATKSSSVGEYDVEISGGESNNYTFSQYKKGTLAIEPVPLTITPINITRYYGDKNPEYTFSYSGFVNNDDSDSLTVAPFATCSAKISSEVGEYQITVDGAVSPNYDISYGSAVLTIEKAPLKIQAEDVTREYGVANPEFIFIYDGFKNDENESVLLKKPTAQSANIVSAVGTYDIISSGADAKNYRISYGKGVLTITQAPLSVTAKDASREYGKENPKFSVSYSGFKFDDDESSISTKPSVKTTADLTSPVGDYAIHPYGGNSKNYYFEKYNDGTLTITKTNQNLVWNQDLSDVVIMQEKELLAVADSKLPVEYTISDNKIASIEKIGNKSYLNCIGVGEVLVTATQNGDENYYKTNSVTKSITIHNLPDKTVPIEIKQGESGAVCIQTEIGFTRTFTFNTAEGWYIHSVTFNGRDVTDEMVDSTYTTPIISDASSLVVAYSDTPDAVVSRRANTIRVYGDNGVLHVTGTNNGDIITVYDEEGKKVAKEISSSQITDIPLKCNTLYIVSVGENVIKILM